MKIGDRVSFLSDSGGGIIAGFQKNNIVLVEDEDGFQIPTLASQIVVVAESADDYNMYKVPSAAKSKDGSTTPHAEGRSVKSILNDNDDDNHDYSPDIYDPKDDPSLGEITFKAPVQEKKGGDRLSAYLVFIPVGKGNASATGSVTPLLNGKESFEMYLVNDCNYYLHYSLLQAEGASWTMRSVGELEPNTRTFIEEVTHEDLESLQHLGVQMIPYKRDKSFIIKPTVDVQLRIDGVKFYKLHTFLKNRFFEQDALIFNIIENDVPARPLVVDAKQLKKDMYADPEAARKPKREFVARKEDNDAVIIDLHIDALLDSTQGMSSADILQYQMDCFHRTIAEYKKQKGKRLIFIHGKGDGVLRRSIINSLNYRYKFLRYQDASFQEYGYGATQVTV